jgi:hypothetical protein
MCSEHLVSSRSTAAPIVRRQYLLSPEACVRALELLLKKPVATAPDEAKEIKNVKNIRAE